MSLLKFIYGSPNTSHDCIEHSVFAEVRQARPEVGDWGGDALVGRR